MDYTMKNGGDANSRDETGDVQSGPATPQAIAGSPAQDIIYNSSRDETLLKARSWEKCQAAFRRSARGAELEPFFEANFGGNHRQTITAIRHVFENPKVTLRDGTQVLNNLMIERARRWPRGKRSKNPDSNKLLTADTIKQAGNLLKQTLEGKSSIDFTPLVHEELIRLGLTINSAGLLIKGEHRRTFTFPNFNDEPLPSVVIYSEEPSFRQRSGLSFPPPEVHSEEPSFRQRSGLSFPPAEVHSEKADFQQLSGPSSHPFGVHSEETDFQQLLGSPLSFQPPAGMYSEETNFEQLSPPPFSPQPPAGVYSEETNLEQGSVPLFGPQPPAGMNRLNRGTIGFEGFQQRSAQTFNDMGRASPTDSQRGDEPDDEPVGQMVAGGRWTVVNQTSRATEEQAFGGVQVQLPNGPNLRDFGLVRGNRVELTTQMAHLTAKAEGLEVKMAHLFAKTEDYKKEIAALNHTMALEIQKHNRQIADLRAEVMMLDQLLCQQDDQAGENGHDGH
jgi:hypothetical protein